MCSSNPYLEWWSVNLRHYMISSKKKEYLKDENTRIMDETPTVDYHGFNLYASN